MYQVRTRYGDEPVSGFDSAIMAAPDDIYVTVNGKATIVVNRLARLLSEISESSAADLGVKLHHGDWVLTTDPAEVSRLGLMHDCPTCRAGVDQALAHLKQFPQSPLLVGLLYWA